MPRIFSFGAAGAAAEEAGVGMGVGAAAGGGETAGVCPEAREAKKTRAAHMATPTADLTAADRGLAGGRAEVPGEHSTGESSCRCAPERGAGFTCSHRTRKSRLLSERSARAHGRWP